MGFLTVITPTFNRANELNSLYMSLVNQTDQDFLWMIIDDGSTDNTEAIVKDYVSEHKIDIEYIKKPNGGKHTALNEGIKRIDSKWTFIVDSDDYLKPEAVATIRDKAQLDDSDEICGLAFLRESKNGGYLTNKLVPQDGMISDFISCRYGMGIKGDMAEVWKTEYLKETPFPVFEGEKFCSEDVVWIELALKYKMIFYNTAIYVSDYLDGGLTKSRRSLNKKSPKGVMYRGIVQLKAKLPLKYMCRAMLYYQVYGKAAGYSFVHLFSESSKKLLFVVMLPVTMIIYRKLI